MKTIQFFDDWLLQSHRGLVRKWFQAEPWPGYEVFSDPNLKYSFTGQCVFRDQESGKWMMTAGGFSESLDDRDGHTFVYSSDDGICWSPYIINPENKGKEFRLEYYMADKSPKNGLDDSKYSGCGLSCVDYTEKNPDWRFKVMMTDFKSKDAATGNSMWAFSPDGINWKVDPDSVFRHSVCDGGARVLFNPYTQKYQFTQRSCWLDRRIFLYQTKDFRNFEGPTLIVHPDAQDGLVEFYSMQHFLYEGGFVGFVVKQHGDYSEACHPARSFGRTDVEFLYSVNGITWNRPVRSSFLPEPDSGLLYRGQYYPDMVMDDEGWLRFYTSVNYNEHGSSTKSTKGPPSALAISRLRRDGFCAYECDSSIAEMTLRPLISEGGEILLNAKTSRYGYIRAELRMAPDNKPIPGYELANSVPVEGDGHFLKLRWKERENLDPIKGKAYRLYIELVQARIYAIRLNACYLLGWHPQPNLTGSFYPGILYGTDDWEGAKPLDLTDKKIEI